MPRGEALPHHHVLSSNMQLFIVDVCSPLAQLNIQES